ncbi:MAG: peptide chain release factor N(5)-glutamine methyltransferase [Pseudomonadota bacterium]
MTAVRALLADAGARLAASSPSPRVDADVLLAHVLQRDLTWLRVHDQDEIPAPDCARFAAALARREQGEPVAYITGTRGFWSLDLAVDAATLIPRADTETLVEWALELLPQGVNSQALDLGTGSGAIALALKAERPRCAISAVDRSPAALAVARGNGERLGLPVRFIESDWYARLGGERFDVIVANPPYIAENDPHLVQGDLRFEPASALVAPAQGLGDLRHIIEGARRHLLRDGWLLLEHGHEQGRPVREMLQDNGFAAVDTRRDLGGNERCSGGRWPC